MPARKLIFLKRKMTKRGILFTEDKSLFYYGWFYHKLFDRELTAAREIAVDLVLEGSSVLDIACGTGQLCFALKARKNCRVVGIDLSLRQLRFAEKSNSNGEVTFLHMDATNLVGIDDHSFDYAAVLFLMHELTREQQARVLTEASRVADKIVIIDSVVPLPKNLGGRLIRFVEATFGRDHNRNFKDFLANNGIHGILEYVGLPMTEMNRSVFWRDCREAVLISVR
jgi:ubiquinone/menaquinone biosynthesis C-methylase UbiE